MTCLYVSYVSFYSSVSFAKQALAVKSVEGPFFAAHICLTVAVSIQIHLEKNTAFHFSLLHTHLNHNTKIPSLIPISLVITYICGLYWVLSFVSEPLDDRFWMELYLPQSFGDRFISVFGPESQAFFIPSPQTCWEKSHWGFVKSNNTVLMDGHVK